MSRWSWLVAVTWVFLGIAPAHAQALSVAPLASTTPGGIAPVTILAPGTEGPTLTAFGRQLPVEPAGDGRWTALVGVDLDVPPGPHAVRVARRRPDGTELVAETMLDVRARPFPTRRLTVAPSFVDPSPADAARMAAEAERLTRLYTLVSPRRWQGAFSAPIPRAVATSNFGARSVFNGQPRAPHAGVDYRGVTGTPVRAPAAGLVVLADSLFLTGNTVVLDHGLGIVSILAHLSRLDVQVGQEVPDGMVLGLVGATGRVTGPHLHWSVRLGTARVDPLLLLALRQ